jgi:hypothetical protein
MFDEPENVVRLVVFDLLMLEFVLLTRTACCHRDDVRATRQTSRSLPMTVRFSLVD